MCCPRIDPVKPVRILDRHASQCCVHSRQGCPDQPLLVRAPAKQPVACDPVQQPEWHSVDIGDDASVPRHYRGARRNACRLDVSRDLKAAHEGTARSRRNRLGYPPFTALGDEPRRRVHSAVVHLNRRVRQSPIGRETRTQLPIIDHQHESNTIHRNWLRTSDLTACPPRHPVCHRPALRGAGHRPARHVKRTLTPDGRWRVGRWPARLARVDGRRDGPPQPPTDRDPPMGPRPSWSRSAPAGGALTATPRPPPLRRRGRRALPYAARARGRAARPAAGPPPPGQRPCRAAAAHRASRYPRQPPGIRRDGRRATAAVAGARPGGGACGPSRAALKTYRNFEPLRRQPGVLRRLMVDTAASVDV